MVSQEAYVRRRLSSRIRSGKLKISAPISNPADSDDIHDSEQPPVPPLPASPGAATILTTGTRVSEGMRTPVSPLRQNPTRSRVVSHGSDFENLVGVRHDSLSRPQSMEWERQARQDASTRGRTTRPASQAHLQTPRQQAARNSSHGITPPSSHNTPGTIDTVKGKHGRSSLRFALRKILGIRQKGEEHRSTPPTRQGLPPGESETAMIPTAPGYGGSAMADPIPSYAERVADMGAGVTQQPQSHHVTPFSMDDEAAATYNVPPFSPSTPETPTQQRRRATLPSIIRASSEAANLAALWDLQYSRHLAGGDKQNPKLSVRDSDIGVAVTSSATNNVHTNASGANFGFASNNSNNTATPKRRSRSAGALHELIRSQSGMRVRKRSDEIRYWRQSLLPPAVTSLSTRSLNYNDGIDDSLIASPDTVPLADPTYVGTTKTDDNAFSFQRLTEIEPSSTEKGYHNIDPSSTSLKKRIDRLEAELATMERSMRKLKGRSHRQTVIMQEDGGPARRRDRQSRWLHGREHEQLAGDERPSSSDSSRTPPRLRSPFLPSVAGAGRWRRQHHSHSPSYRTSSNSQHHPYTSAYTYGLSAEAPGSTQHNADVANNVVTAAAAAAAHEQVRALYLLLSQERSKRKALEVHVSALQRNVSDVRDIAAAAMASAAKPHLYEMPVAPFPANPQLSALPTQVLTDEAAALMDADPRRQTQVSRFSHFDSDDDIDGSGRTGQAGAVTSAGEYDESEAASNTNKSSNTNNETRERRRQSGRKSGLSSKRDNDDDDDYGDEQKMNRSGQDEEDTTSMDKASTKRTSASSVSKAPAEGLQQRRNRPEMLNVNHVSTQPSRGRFAVASAVAGTAMLTVQARDIHEGAEGRIAEGVDGGGLRSPSINSPYTEDDFQTPDEEHAPFSSGLGSESGGQGLSTRVAVS